MSTHGSVAHDRLPTVRVPDTLVGVLQARIDALRADQKSVLHRAAVIGRSFWDRAVAALGDVPDRLGDVDDSIAELRSRELVYGRESSSIADATEYVFKHAVLREVAYQSVLRRYRSVYHARAAAWLSSVVETTERADEFAARIAAHYDAAEQADDAAAWFLRAGTAAADRYANAEALVLLDRAMELASADATDFRFQISQARQSIHAIMGDRVAETAELDYLSVIADELGDDEKRVDVELRRAKQATDVGRQVDSETHARLAADMARRIGDSERETRALLALGTARWRQGKPGEALPVLTEALDIARGRDRRIADGGLPAQQRCRPPQPRSLRRCRGGLPGERGPLEARRPSGWAQPGAQQLGHPGVRPGELRRGPFLLRAGAHGEAGDGRPPGREPRAQQPGPGRRCAARLRRRDGGIRAHP